jgi:Fe-Mn family superoxide dismutase
MYEPKDYSKLIGMEGFSETLLKNHFTLYQGYVTNTNKALGILDQMLKEDKAGAYEYAEVQRRLGWEFNGMGYTSIISRTLGAKAALPEAPWQKRLLKSSAAMSCSRKTSRQ